MRAANDVGGASEPVELARLALVFAGLRALFPAPSWALVRGVREATEDQTEGDSIADAVALNLWPGPRGGWKVHGIKVALSRESFLQRVSARPWQRRVYAYNCSSWSFAVPGPWRDIVRPGELPRGWGVIAVDAEGRGEFGVDPAVYVASTPSLVFVQALLRAATRVGPVGAEGR